MARAGVLRSVHAILERHAPLRTFLGHALGATTVEAGARIIGDSVRVQSLPLPVVVLSFEGGDAIAPQREQMEWNVELALLGNDVFQVAEVLDLTEAACLAYRYDRLLPQPLNRVLIGKHERLAVEAPQGRVIGVRLVLTASWVRVS